MAKQTINLGTADKGNGDPLRTAFNKVNENFTELYNALGLDVGDLNIGSFEFTDNTITTTDSTNIIIDQAVVMTSELEVGGDIVPNVANQHTLGTPAKPFKSLYVSNQTIYLGGTPLSLDPNTNELNINNVPVSQTITYSDIPNVPTDVSDLTDTEGLLGGAANLGNLKIESSTIGTQGQTGNSWGNYNLYLDPGGESNAYISIPSVAQQESGAALQIYNKGDASSIVQVFGQGGVQIVTNTGEDEHVFEFRDDGKLQLPPSGDILDSTGTSVIGGVSPTQPYLELTNEAFITQPVVLGTPVTITAAPQGVGAQVVVTITEGSVLDSITIFEPGTGYVAGQNYIIWSYQIGGPMPGDSLTLTIGTVDGNGGILTITNAAFLGVPQNVAGVYVTALNYQASVFDEIDTGLTLARDLNQGIYNVEAEIEYDNSTYLSPLGTEWNADGWGDLTGLATRTYTTWRQALNNAVGNYIVASELVMHDTINDKYYKFDFTAWNSNNGSYAYTRTEVTDPNYFRKTDNGNEVDIIIEDSGVGELESIYTDQEFTFADYRNNDALDILPATRSWAGLPSYQAYDQIILYNGPISVPGLLVVAANSARQAYLTWQAALEEFGPARGVGITRDGNNGIYNPYREGSWDDTVSPGGIGWNIDGWADLSDVESRTYINLYAAFGFGGLGNKIVGTECVIYVPDNGKYYAVKFSAWTQGGGGGFSYTRKEIDLTKVNEGVKFSDGTVLKSAQGIGRVKSTAVGDRRIEEATGYNQVTVTQRVTTNLTTVASRAETGGYYIWIDSTATTIDDIINTPANYGDAYEFEFSLNNTVWYTWTGGIGNSGNSTGYSVTQPLTYLQGDTVYFRYKTGGGSVVWWDKVDLPGGSGNFRGAVIDYHAYTGDGTIIGTIHIVDDDGEEHISHQEVQSGSTDGENDDLWLVTSEGQIRYRRIDGESATLKIHWTAKVFYGSEFYD